MLSLFSCRSCHRAAQNGRIKGEQKKALRNVIERYELPVTLTPHQNIILRDVDPAWKADISASLAAVGLGDWNTWDSLDRLSMACPALPLCGLAVTEAERSLPDINKRIRASLTKVGMGSETMVIRMTGCPNGCARPYMAELGFVGDGPNSYQIYIGGNPNQTRLADLYADRVKVKDLEATLEPIFAAWRDGRKPGEAFGDFGARLGMAGLKAAAAAAAATMAPASVDPAVAKALSDAAKAQGKTVEQLAADTLKQLASK